MYDAKKIGAGVFIFLILFTIPLWYSQASGEADYVPDPVIAADAGEQCVESAEYMLHNHMSLLDNWRHTVVRDTNRVYYAEDGKTWDMSLTDTCLGCHTNKSDFCDQCHDYTDVKPRCWDCHNIVEGK